MEIECHHTQRQRVYKRKEILLTEGTVSIRFQQKKKRSIQKHRPSPTEKKMSKAFLVSDVFHWRAKLTSVFEMSFLFPVLSHGTFGPRLDGGTNLLRIVWMGTSLLLIGLHLLPNDMESHIRCSTGLCLEEVTLTSPVGRLLVTH